MNAPDLSQLLPRYFAEHLIGQRNVSPRTVATYRDAFRLLLRFLQRSHKCPASDLPLSLLNAHSVLAFLNYLERERHNNVRSRNARLMAVRSFVHYASDLLGPELPDATRRILAVPLKRYSRPLLGFLTHDEVQSVLSETDDSWTGRRDHLLFLLLYNTGGRISEILAARAKDALAHDCRHLLLHGKGRKERQVPLWRSTQQLLRRWIKDNHLADNSPLLPNRFGQPLNRSGVAWQLRKLVRLAAKKAPSLKNRRISPHTFRHSTAMHLLQAGVAPEVIALWLGHESPNTTHLYVEADLEMKRRTLESLPAPKVKHENGRPADKLLQFLEGL
jgi:site-specific recombinase XerD